MGHFKPSDQRNGHHLLESDYGIKRFIILKEGITIPFRAHSHFTEPSVSVSVLKLKLKEPGVK